MSELSAAFLFLILYTYFGYFAIVAILGIFFNRKVKKDRIFPTVTLMIAAYNEEIDIAEKIENSLALDYPEGLLDIVIVSDASSDRTDEIAKSYENRGVRLVRVEGRVGKTQARNIAMREVRSEIVVFSDATTIYEKDIIEKMVRNFADPSVGMVTGHLLYVDQSGGQIGIGQRLFWRYESFIKKCQTRLGTLTGSVGCASAFRRSAYAELPSHVIEDFTEPLMFVMRGYRVVFEEEAICREKTTAKSTQEWSMRVRVVSGGLTGLMYARNILNPFRYPLACFQLVSHKLLRWMVPVFAICLFSSSGIGALVMPENHLLKVLFATQILFYFAVALGFYLERRKIKAKILGVPHYFFIVNAAALAALYKTIFKPAESTWETERSA